MKNLIYTLLLGSILWSGTMVAQNKPFPNAIHAKLCFNDFGLPNNQDLRLGESFEIGYFRNIASFLNIGIPVKVGLAKLPGSTVNTQITSVDLILHIENTRSQGGVIPYAFGGGGYFFEKFTNSHVQIPFGAGLKIRVSQFAMLNLQGEYRMSMVENRSNIQFGIGFISLLHITERSVPGQNPNAPADFDKDSVPDVLDKCPEIAGSATAMGCPDRDADTVADAEDICPDEAGTVETNGCPDADLDGLADADDECPTEAGTLAGCPDNDFDGFADKDDLCPETAGRLSGCPDTDYDGVADKDDKCPNEPGPAGNNGCPQVSLPKDSDGDGVEDANDLCPDLAGTLDGCPDTDGDGIADRDDKCPTEPGMLSNNGCPEVIIADADADGVPDATDPCPNAAGKLNGCPDADNDGIADKDDKCPDKAGTLEGCPDTDGDGIADNLDKCPDKAGMVSNNGCPEVEARAGQPDSDADGVPDASDPCPYAAGTFNGCPDSDNDGVADNLDKCPATAGPANNRGCPEIKQETRQQLSLAMDAVQFETAKATLKSVSFDILDGVVEIMRQYPDYKLSISGHTDNIGDEDANLELSTSRAKTCYDYLIFRGVRTERLRYAGFGEARPIADNNTPAGREKNRRVEFDLTLE